MDYWEERRESFILILFSYLFDRGGKKVLRDCDDGFVSQGFTGYREYGVVQPVRVLSSFVQRMLE